MTVSNVNSSVRYTGDGSTDVFTLTFPFGDNTNIRVFVDNVLVTTGFTITGGAPTGTCTFDTAPSNGADVFFRRVVPLTQKKAYPTNDTFPSASHEAALDKLTFVSQQLSRDITFSLTFPESLDITAGVLPTPEDDAILAWDGVTGTVKNGPTTAAFVTATSTAVAAAATATTQAGIATTQAGISTTQAGLATNQVTYATEWAQNPEDDPVSVAAGGDDSTTFSALHWAAKAEAFAVSIDLPALGTANTVLQVNSAGTDLEYGAVATANIEDEAITNAKLANMAQATIKGRQAGSGTGVPEDLTAAQVHAIIGSASESATGVVELLTNAEFNTGTDTDRAMVASNFAKSIAASGYITLPGGLIVQWGSIPATNTGTVTFPVAFTTACDGVTATATAVRRTLGVTAKTTTNFNFEQRLDDGTNSATTWTYIAWGR